MRVNDDYAGRHLHLATLLGENMQMRDKRHFVREWRKSKGLTQNQLAERAGVTQAMVSRVETGNPYDEEFIERVAVALNVTPADLTMRDPSDPEGLWSIYDTLSPVERVQAVKVIKAIRGAGTGG